MTWIVGVDPGVGGAVAFVRRDGREACVLDAPIVTTKGSKRELVPAQMADMLRRVEVDHVGLELVGSRPGEGHAGAFSFGAGWGMWRGVIAGLGLPCDLIRPQEWRKAIGLAQGAEKGASRARAAELWPHLAGQVARVKDDGRAEALLIGEVVRRRLVGGAA